MQNLQIPHDSVTNSPLLIITISYLLQNLATCPMPPSTPAPISPQTPSPIPHHPAPATFRTHPIPPIRHTPQSPNPHPINISITTASPPTPTLRTPSLTPHVFPTMLQGTHYPGAHSVPPTRSRPLKGVQVHSRRRTADVSEDMGAQAVYQLLLREGTSHLACAIHVIAAEALRTVFPPNERESGSWQGKEPWGDEEMIKFARMGGIRACGPSADEVMGGDCAGVMLEGSSFYREGWGWV